jgi:hypothetical protein
LFESLPPFVLDGSWPTGSGGAATDVWFSRPTSKRVRF